MVELQRIHDVSNNSSDDERMIDTGLSQSNAKDKIVTPTSVSSSTVGSFDSTTPIHQSESDYEDDHHDGTSGGCPNKIKPCIVRFNKRVVADDNMSHDNLSHDASSTADSTGFDDSSAANLSAEQLKYKLKQLECELSAEKAMRRKKDKSIVKLAKQLQKCTQDSELKDRQVLKMAKTINDLEGLLHNHHRELADDQEKIRRVCRDTEERLEEYEAMVLSLRKQLADATIEVEMLNAKIQLESAVQQPSTETTLVVTETPSNTTRDVASSGTSSWFPTKQRVAAMAVAGIAVVVSAGLSFHANPSLRNHSTR